MKTRAEVPCERGRKIYMTEQYNLNNRYQFMGLIGKGRLGDVYRAGDTFFRRETALKMIRKETASPEFLQYFAVRYAQQIAVLAKLSNPSIIKVYDFTSLNGVPAWTMDLYSGANYSQYSGTKLPVEQAATLLIPVADALTHAHQYGMIHGNLKPSNILIGNAQNPILTDFALTQWLSENGHGYGQFEASAGIGSPEYLAPEQAQGRPADTRTDVYSLGIIFYELITGHKPFTAMSPMDTMARQVSDQLISPRYYVPSISQQTEQFIFQATAKVPTQRISSMSEFAMMLRSLTNPAAAGAYYPPASYYSNAAPSEDDDDDDDESFAVKLKTAWANLKTNKNAKIILFALLGVIIALAAVLIVNGNNKKIASMNATATQAAINQQAAIEHAQQTAEAQVAQTQEAIQVQQMSETKAAYLAATADALAFMPTEEPLMMIPTTQELVPTAASVAKGRFQSQRPKDNATLITGQAFTMGWTIENTGSVTWEQDYKLVFDTGTNFTKGQVAERLTGKMIWSGGSNELTLPCVAPDYPGQYFMQWHVEDNHGATVFSPLTITINVVSGELTPTPAPTTDPNAWPEEVIYDSSSDEAGSGE